MSFLSNDWISGCFDSSMHHVLSSAVNHQKTYLRDCALRYLQQVAGSSGSFIAAAMLQHSIRSE